MPTTKSKTAKRKTTKSPVSPTGTASASKRRLNHRWVADIHTESTFPPKGLFTQDASTIARNLASGKTSPKGPASGMRMLNYYINRAGRNLSASRQAELERAKSILSNIIARKATARKKRPD